MKNDILSMLGVIWSIVQLFAKRVADALYKSEDEGTLEDELTENKAVAVAMLEMFLQCTRQEGIRLELYYDNFDEFVEITYPDGYKKSVCVACDSNLALARDVLKVL